MAENTENKKTVSILKKACATLWYIAIVLLFLTIVCIFSSKMRGEVPNLFGYSIVKIITPSMEDEIPTGSYILLRSVDAEDVKAGDVICFYSTDPMIYGMPNTHRVVEEPIVTDNGIEFVTRGDANLANDSHHARGDRLVGRYVCKIGILTLITELLEGGGMMVFIIVITVLAFAMVIISAIKVGRAAAEKDASADDISDKKNNNDSFDK